METVVLLDIDGVINPMSPGAPVSAWPPEQWLETVAQSPDGIWWKIRAARPVIRFFHGLHRRGVDVRWHSTWQGASLDVESALGMPEFALQHPFPDGATVRRGDAWKLEAVRYLHDRQGYRVIWVDDQAPAMLRDRIRLGNLEVICPEPRLGLTRYHLELLALRLGTTYEEVIDIDLPRP